MSEGLVVTIPWWLVWVGGGYLALILVGVAIIWLVTRYFDIKWDELT